MHSRKPIGDGLRKCVHTERGRKTHRKIHTKKEGVPLGNPLEKGTKIIPCMSRIKTSLVEVRDILVWELGQTCEAARNGTWIMLLKKALDLQLLQLMMLQKLPLQEKMLSKIRSLTLQSIQKLLQITKFWPIFQKTRKACKLLRQLKTALKTVQKARNKRFRKSLSKFNGMLTASSIKSNQKPIKIMQKRKLIWKNVRS